MTMTQEKAAEGIARLEVRRVIDATPEEVFAAWTDASSMARWMKPGPHTVESRVEADPRVGGTFRIDMIGAEKVYEHTGEYLVVDPPKKLVFTWVSEGTQQGRSIVTIDLHPRGNQTELVLTHEKLPDEKSAQGHKSGWTAIIEMLAEELRA